jgi:hypothetical protein
MVLMTIGYFFKIGFQGKIYCQIEKNVEEYNKKYNNIAK